MLKRIIAIAILFLTICACAVPVRTASALSLTTGRIVGAGIAFRSSARSDSKLIARLPEGTVVRLLEANVNAEWFKVEYAGKIGYVNRMYVSVEPSMDSYKLAYNGTVVNCNVDINVRDSASLTGKKLGVALKGETLNVTQAYYTDGWHQIQFGDATGYVSAKYVELTAKIDDDSLTGLTVTGGTLSPRFSPKEFGYIITATQGDVEIRATANKNVKVSIGNTGVGSAKYSINSGNSKTIRISLDGTVRYTLYLVRDVLTVGTWNIKRGNSHLVEQGWLIANENPDIVGIQEVFSDNRNDINNLKSIRTRNAQYMSFASTVDYPDGSQYGIGQISRFEPLSNEKFQLYDGGKEARYLQKVVYNVDGKKVSFYNTHFSWEGASIRKQQFAAVLKQMNADENEFKILTGDFNAKEAEFDAFKSNYKIINTSLTKFYDYSQNRMTFSQIDNIIVSKNITVLNARALPTKYSDHYPLFAFLRLK